MGSPDSTAGNMSATSGPVPDFYYPTSDGSGSWMEPTSPTDTARAAVQSSTRRPLLVHPPPNPFNYPTLNNAKSTPVLVSPVLTGSVKDMANQFDQAGTLTKGAKHPQLTVRTTQDRYKKAGVTKSSNHVSPRSPTKSPTKDGTRKLQKPRPARPRSPTKSPDTSFTSFENSNSFNSTTSITNPKSRPHTAFAPKQQSASFNGPHYITAPPLFGEITSDGKWNANFPLNNYPNVPTFTDPRRRSSDGNIALSHGRSISHQEMLQPTQSASQNSTLTHKRSRSEMDAYSQQAPAYPTPPNSGTRVTSPTSSRIPVRSRYTPAPNEPSGQKLSAKIVAPSPKTSPPLRSSRPRQPVSAATTSASRARAAEHFPNTNTMQPRDLRRPSEQWLGKPYDAQKERSRRKIPELGNINFEERRARIQKAISQNLEESRSLEELRAKSRSRQASRDALKEVSAGAENGSLEVTPELPQNGFESMPGEWPTPGALTVDTFNVPDQAQRADEPQTTQNIDSAGTEFEIDESPVLGKPSNESDAQPALPTLLTAAVYQPRQAIKPSDQQLQSTTLETPAPSSALLPSPSVLDNVMRMREPSPGRSDFADDSSPESGGDSPSDIENKWGIGRGLDSVSGSIKIMLDEPWANGEDDNFGQSPELAQTNSFETPRQYNQHAFASNHYTESPVDHRDAYSNNVQYQTRERGDTIRASDSHAMDDFAEAEARGYSRDVTRLLRHYQSTGTLTAEMVEHVQKHMVDLQRVSANEGSNGFMIQNLLDSIVNSQQEQPAPETPEARATLQTSFDFDIPAVTPDTPVGWEFSEDSGHAIVYTNEDNTEFTDGPEEEEADDFHVKIQRANDAWERQQHGEYVRLGAEDNEEEDTLRPEPPPKDAGYTPRSSTGDEGRPNLPQDFSKGLRISTTGHLDLPATFAGDRVEQKSSAPPPPVYAPPPPPPASSSPTNLPFGMPEVPPIPAAYSERGSSDMSPRARKHLWPQSGSSRPSIDSQRVPSVPPVPASVSATSLTGSIRQDSIWDVDAADSQTMLAHQLAKAKSESPEQKRLLKRRHIIRELLDTENTYHQDLKIIEDIYRATAVPDVISPDDKKILFSNCDEIERFSLHFYDELRKAAAAIYVPAKKGWANNNRGSMSTNDSDPKAQPNDGVDDEKDRCTTIGQAFVQNLQRMEQVYSVYLKNHDIANQRLSALRNTPTIKCWLDECHNNASDITFAWDLDSLLVKPTQRAAKYPLLLMQLLETTPSDHPDRGALSSASKDVLDMLTRINDAKKRADLVDQIVNRKRKESDVRTGISRAFGRRTEKLKERVGIAEAFQDPEFDDLAHKFGGHFIRLQICMRDVQGYINRINKAVDQICSFANGLDDFADVSVSSIPELDSKWRHAARNLREVTHAGFAEHKAEIERRVVNPMITCIKLHEGPQNAINNRKKRIVDYAKCKAIEKRGEKPDKKTLEASDLYVALNDQLKIELPKLYSLTGSMVQGTLNCFLDVQLKWFKMWELKMRPTLEEQDIPGSIEAIETAFRPDHEIVKSRLLSLGICNGAVLADSANFLSPASTLEETTPSSGKRPSTLESAKRTVSMGSEISPAPGSAAHKRTSSGYMGGEDALPYPYDSRIRSNSSHSGRYPHGQPNSAGAANSSWNRHAISPLPSSRPATSDESGFLAGHPPGPPRSSRDLPRSPRPVSGATYFTARPEQPDERPFSDLFSSAMPEDGGPNLTSPQSAQDDTPVICVCASLFEFSIEKTRREGGYPYLTYVQGEVFDVIAQKGELWLAKNQDDSTNTIGWIWEQHFVILSQD